MVRHATREDLPRIYEIYENARAYMKRNDIEFPLISSACPAMVRLIGLRFPYLVKNLVPILPPIEYAARLARHVGTKSLLIVTQPNRSTVIIPLKIDSFARSIAPEFVVVSSVLNL